MRPVLFGIFLFLFQLDVVSENERSIVEPRSVTMAAPLDPAIPHIWIFAQTPAETVIGWESVGNRSFYRLERKEGRSGNWIEIARPGGDATSFVDRNVSRGKTYCYQICSSSESGDTPFSYPVCVAVPVLGEGETIWSDAAGRLAIGWVVGSSLLPRLSFSNLPMVPSGTKLAGVSDFNSDRQQDLLWLNPNGTFSAWIMDGTNLARNLPLTNFPVMGESWKFSGLADFNSDNHKDLLWQNNSNGRLAVGFLHRLNPVSSTILSNLPPVPGARVVALGDFGGDGHTDILWQNQAGRQSLWTMVETNRLASAFVRSGKVVPSGWRVAAVTAINDDEKDDLLLQHRNGAVLGWIMNGPSVQQSLPLMKPRLQWRILGGVVD